VGRALPWLAAIGATAAHVALPVLHPHGVAGLKRRLAWAGGAMAACLLLGSCAAPVPSYDAYRHAALETATAMLSSLAAAKLAAQDDLDAKNLFSFTDDNVTNAENDANSVSSTFGSRQPPGPRSMALSQKMSQALSQATSALSSLRIAVRTGSRPKILQALTAVNKALRAFRGLQGGLQ
jgi:hypothetical protein